MDNRIYGYARVSTREQNEDRQIEALTKFGVPEQNIIIDKASGKDTEREGYQYLKRQILRKGDTLVIKELDRLSRNKTDIKRELEQFKDMGIRVKILDIPTTLTDFPPEQEWVLEMINAILIEVLGAIAENERNKIRARQREGIVAAKKKNVRFGRPPKSLPEDWREILAEVRCGNKKPVEAIRELGISRSSTSFIVTTDRCSLLREATILFQDHLLMKESLILLLSISSSFWQAVILGI